jgi:hypothetical protein
MDLPEHEHLTKLRRQRGQSLYDYGALRVRYGVSVRLPRSMRRRRALIRVGLGHAVGPMLPPRRHAAIADDGQEPGARIYSTIIAEVPERAQRCILHGILRIMLVSQ